MLIVDNILYFLILVFLNVDFPRKCRKAKHPPCGDKETGLTRQRSFLNSPQATQEDHRGDVEDVRDQMMGNRAIR